MRRLQSLAVLAGVFAIEIAVSCKSNSISNDSSTHTTIGQLCTSSGSSASECSGSVCAVGYCRQACTASTDCPPGSICLSGAGGVSGCRLPNEASCDASRPCTQGLVCAKDQTCRNGCDGAAGCAISGNACVDGACVGSSEPEPGSGGDSGSESNTDGGREPSCDPACGAGFQCVDGTCKECGKAEGEPCCGSACGSNLTCSSGVCKCGDPGTSCCGGTTCKNSVSCVSGTCACGQAGQACCPTTPACTGNGLTCVGANCTCLKACLGGQGVGSFLVTRSDDTTWFYQGVGSTPAMVTISGGAPFIATSVARGSLHACGARADGTTWCWSLPGGANNNGQLGNATTSASAIPVQVVTDGVGTPLTGTSKVFAGGSTSCAIDGSGALWCWGRGAAGMLGSGGTSDLAVATAVKNDAGGTQFSGVAEVAIGGNHVCARKTDNTVWCWGGNGSGQLGVNSASATIPYPTQVTDLFATTTNISADADVSCARTMDGSVWCWGSNLSGQLGNGSNTGTSRVPVQVLATKGGAPFAGAASVVVMNQGACLVKSADASLWCWGSYNGQGLVPVQWIESSVPVSGIYIPGLGRSNTSPCYVGHDGRIHPQVGGGNTGLFTHEVACP